MSRSQFDSDTTTQTRQLPVVKISVAVASVATAWAVFGAVPAFGAVLGAFAADHVILTHCLRGEATEHAQLCEKVQILETQLDHARRINAPSTGSRAIVPLPELDRAYRRPTLPLSMAV